MANKYLIDVLKKSVFKTKSSPSKYESLVKEILPLSYQTTDSDRFNTPGSATFAIPAPQSGPNCSLGGYWINAFTNNNGNNGDYVYPLSQNTDNECNYFCAYVVNSPYTSSYQKFDSSGASIFSTYETISGVDISETTVDSSGNLYVCYSNGVRKLDPEGNILWEKFFQDVDVYGISVNSSGEIYINGDSEADNNTVKCIAKLSSEGDVLIQKEVTVDLANSISTYTGTKLDSQENVIWSIVIYGYDGDGSYSNLFLKLDQDLNVIWDTRLDPTNQINDYDVTEFALDSSDNLYANHYYNTIAKYDSNGDFVWARALSSSLSAWYVGCQGLGASENGEVFYVGVDDKSNIEVNGYEGVCYITKMNTDGDLQFISYISGSSTLSNASWNIAQAMTTVKSNALNFCFGSYNGKKYYFAKLPLTQVPNGTYGDLQFVDITNDPNLQLQAFTNTSRVSTGYNIATSTLFNNTVSETSVTQVGTGVVITNTTI